MKITKTVDKAYTADFFPGVWRLNQRTFLGNRRSLGLPTKEYETCFCCGTVIPDNEIPTVISVHGIGNRLACRECTERIVEGDTDDTRRQD